MIKKDLIYKINFKYFRTIHMKIASLTTVPDDPLKIIINSGTSEIILKASTIEEK